MTVCRLSFFLRSLFTSPTGISTWPSVPPRCFIEPQKRNNNKKKLNKTTSNLRTKIRPGRPFSFSLSLSYDCSLFFLPASPFDSSFLTIKKKNCRVRSDFLLFGVKEFIHWCLNVIPSELLHLFSKIRTHKKYTFLNWLAPKKNIQWILQLFELPRSGFEAFHWLWRYHGNDFARHWHPSQSRMIIHLELDWNTRGRSFELSQTRISLAYDKICQCVAAVFYTKAYMIGSHLSDNQSEATCSLVRMRSQKRKDQVLFL